MINGFVLKKGIAKVYSMFGISDRKLISLNTQYDNKYIRVINYHHVSDVRSFERQIKYYKEHFIDVDYISFERFKETGELPGSLPGIMITFDDGFRDNYLVGFQVLKQYGFTGWFMVSSDLVGEDGYMTKEQISEMVRNNHVLGCHTATHHRMNELDTDELLDYEIIESRRKLENEFGISVDIFCWCGGEEEHYTKRASEKVKEAGYKYGFMTNSYPLTKETDRLHIQRTNVEDDWSLALVKFQICGFMDKRFKKKRKRVDEVTR